MTVQQLIDELEQFDPDEELYFFENSQYGNSSVDRLDVYFKEMTIQGRTYPRTALVMHGNY